MCSPTHPSNIGVCLLCTQAQEKSCAGLRQNAHGRRMGRAGTQRHRPHRDVTIFRTRKHAQALTGDWRRVWRPGLAWGACGRLRLCTAGRAPASRTRAQVLGKRHRSKSRVPSCRRSSGAAPRGKTNLFLPQDQNGSQRPKLQPRCGPRAPAPARGSRTGHAPSAPASAKAPPSPQAPPQPPAQA